MYDASLLLSSIIFHSWLTPLDKFKVVSFITTDVSGSKFKWPLIWLLMTARKAMIGLSSSNANLNDVIWKRHLHKEALVSDGNITKGEQREM